jgi:hypothetical protein
MIENQQKLQFKEEIAEKQTILEEIYKDILKIVEELNTLLSETEQSDTQKLYIFQYQSLHSRYTQAQRTASDMKPKTNEINRFFDSIPAKEDIKAPRFFNHSFARAMVIAATIVTIGILTNIVSPFFIVALTIVALTIGAINHYYQYIRDNRAYKAFESYQLELMIYQEHKPEIDQILKKIKSIIKIVDEQYKQSKEKNNSWTTLTQDKNNGVIIQP